MRNGSAWIVVVALAVSAFVGVAAVAQSVREHSLEPHIEAPRHDIDGLVDALVTDAANGAG